MEVQLLSHTQNPQRVIYAAAKQCYSKKDAYSIFQSAEKESPGTISAFIKELMQRGHLSTVEHVSFTFAISGVSRVCTHQLVRHRIASYSQQSARYVDMDNFEYVVPSLIEKDALLKEKYIKAVEQAKETYQQMKAYITEKKNLDKEAINQDLRFLLPQAVTTKIVVTMNCRELLHFFAERLCSRAQWEIREVGEKMLEVCKNVLPEVFGSAGAKCEEQKSCPEGDKSCGRYPAK